METSKIRQSLRTILLIALTSTLTLSSAHGLFTPMKEYSRLLELMTVQNEDKTLYVFDEFQESNEEACNAACIEYFRKNPDLVRKIQEDLGGGEVQWQLNHIQSRLLFIPEKRQEYARLFEDYSRDVISYILDQTKLNNPYDKIAVLLEEKPKVSQKSVTAFLVYDIVTESISSYRFYNDKGSLNIRFTEKSYSGEVGSYSSNVRLVNTGTFEFVRNNHTLWKSHSDNPYTALMVPVEETLHILLREHTHRAIKDSLIRDGITDVSVAEVIVKEWVAVEEAVVGGLVHELLPAYIERHVRKLPSSYIEEDIKSKAGFDRYKYLPKAIDLVKSMGCKPVLKLYSNDPVEFKRLLST